jgi:hypothetical protein
MMNMNTRVNLMLLILICSLGYFIGPSYSEPMWQPLGGPYGGSINYFVFSPGRARTIFAGFADESYSAYPIFRSEDGAATWKQLGVKGVMRVNPQDTSVSFLRGRVAGRQLVA